jgi:N-acetylglucosaminyldiphosphoundecaprenol N-acetyl-beta-D-mannosaminyltransferase
MKETTILGSKLHLLSPREATDWVVSNWGFAGRMKYVVTSYSEFFVRASEDERFRHVINAADLVTPDGVSALMASDFVRYSNNKHTFQRLVYLMVLISRALSGKYKTVSGVYLFGEMMQLAHVHRKRVFLLGGWGDVSKRVTDRLREDFEGLEVCFDAGEVVVGSDKRKNQQVIKKINDFAPDILCVAYNPVTQEKWMYDHRDKLKAGVAIGLGGTFNEFLGDFPKSPSWMERSGLKWLWRVVVDPKRLPRIYRAVVVFPVMVWKSVPRQK